MIDLTEVIFRLRDVCPVFERRVGGTASFDAATSVDRQFPLPHAFVVPTDETAKEADGNATAQRITERFAVVVAVDNRQNPDDGAGKVALSVLEDVRRQLLAGLLGWEPVQIGKPPMGIPEELEDMAVNSRADWVRYIGARHIMMTNGRLWHQFDFELSYYDGEVDADYETHVGTFDASGGTVALYDGETFPGAGTAEVLSVVLPTGERVLPRDWSFDAASGVVTLDPVPEVKIVWRHRPFMPLVTQVWAEYFPELLAQAGGDPNAITPDMFRKISELPPDATILEWINPDADIGDPQHAFGVTRYAVDADGNVIGGTAPKE